MTLRSRINVAAIAADVLNVSGYKRAVQRTLYTGTLFLERGRGQGATIENYANTATQHSGTIGGSASSTARVLHMEHKQTRVAPCILSWKESFACIPSYEVLRQMLSMRDSLVD